MNFFKLQDNPATGFNWGQVLAHGDKSTQKLHFMKLGSVVSNKRLAVAPMMEWTDRHCRSFHRTLTKEAVLYTEMVTTGALIHGDVSRHLDYSQDQHPVVLQLGGSEPSDLAKAAELAQQWGYDEIDLNCGCPSGACSAVPLALA